jgi:hypothetical protein
MFFKIIDKYLAINKNSKIFIATDSQNVFLKFKKRYKNRLIYWNSIRSFNETSLHVKTKTNKKFSRYKLGEDALIEAMLLSRCDFLIRNESNLSATACIFNMKLKQLNLSQLLVCKSMNEDWIEQTYIVDGFPLIDNWPKLKMTQYYFNKALQKVPKTIIKSISNFI